MEALRDLLAATEPYVEKAAPHEQLFSGEDLRNFDNLVAARTKAKAALAAMEAGQETLTERAEKLRAADGSSSSSHEAAAAISHERRTTGFDVGQRGLATHPPLPAGMSMPGTICRECGGMMIRTGTCETCTSCGYNDGCG